MCCIDLRRAALVMQDINKDIPHPVKDCLLIDIARSSAECGFLSSPGQLTSIHKVSSFGHRGGKIIARSMESQIFL